MSLLNTVRSSLISQYAATLRTLEHCLEACSDQRWNAPVAAMTFDQVVFHALVFTDVYLGLELASLKEQEFHGRHQAEFGDYEEFEQRPPVQRYSKSFVGDYLTHCLNKSNEVINAETEESLETSPGFEWLPCSRLEVHVYNIRHLHHHAAQLAIHLRLQDDVSIPWVGQGGRNAS